MARVNGRSRQQSRSRSPAATATSTTADQCKKGRKAKEAGRWARRPGAAQHYCVLCCAPGSVRASAPCTVLYRATPGGAGCEPGQFDSAIDPIYHPIWSLSGSLHPPRLCSLAPSLHLTASFPTSKQLPNWLEQLRYLSFTVAEVEVGVEGLRVEEQQER